VVNKEEGATACFSGAGVPGTLPWRSWGMDPRDCEGSRLGGAALDTAGFRSNTLHRFLSAAPARRGWCRAVFF